MKQLTILMSASTLIAAALSMPLESIADTWRGTAPFCAGSCLKGERQIGVSDYGDGGYCVTGHKVLCSNNSQSCKATESQATCYGVVMICENGYQETLNQVWHTCDTYACGLCVGSGSTGIHPMSTGGASGFQTDICKPGFVWREAVKSDHACVPPASRDQAAEDNAAGGARRSLEGGASGPDTCRGGFVWREAVAGDHVCVTPTVRSATADENRLAPTRVAPQPTTLVIDTCKRGYVWREAIKGDHVCVLPSTRSQAASDNAQASTRRLTGAPPSNPDACKPGFVWREVVPSDHVCVVPAVVREGEPVARFSVRVRLGGTA